MIMEVYAIKDRLTGFLSPVIENNENVAIRMFTELVNDPNTNIHRTPRDYDLYHLGKFDTETGAISGSAPRLLVSGSEVIVRD